MTTDRWSLARVADQTGRTALITGANSGLGRATASALARAGATVLLACRNAERADAARTEILRAHPGAHVETLSLDLADLTSVRRCADEVVRAHHQLDLLVNNAGLMATDLSRTAQGFEMQLGVNHLGHFALTLDLLPLLVATPGSRVVTVSSFSHRAGSLRLDDPHARTTRYRRWPAYAQSKLANLLFTYELARRLDASGLALAALAAHPGFARTDLGAEGTSLANRLSGVFMSIGSQSAAGGALPTLRAALDPSAHSGQFYGPRWMLRGRPVLETPSRRARDAGQAAALWTLSEELTGRSYAAALSRRPT